MHIRLTFVQTVKGSSSILAYSLVMLQHDYNSEVPAQDMYPSRDVTFNYRVSYARVNRTILRIVRVSKALPSFSSPSDKKMDVDRQ